MSHSLAKFILGAWLPSNKTAESSIATIHLHSCSRASSRLLMFFSGNNAIKRSWKCLSSHGQGIVFMENKITVRVYYYSRVLANTFYLDDACWLPIPESPGFNSAFSSSSSWISLHSWEIFNSALLHNNKSLLRNSHLYNTAHNQLTNCVNSSDPRLSLGIYSVNHAKPALL